MDRERFSPSSDRARTTTSNHGVALTAPTHWPVRLGQDGIRANCVARGFVYTPTVDSRGLPEGLREMRRESSILETEGPGGD